MRDSIARTRPENFPLLAYGALIEAALALQCWHFYRETASPWLALNLFFSVNTLLLLPGLLSRRAFLVILPGIVYQAIVFFVLGVEHVLNRTVDFPDLFLLLETNRHEAAEFVTGHGLLLSILVINGLLLASMFYVRGVRLTQRFAMFVLLLLVFSILTGFPGRDIGIVRKVEDFAWKAEAALEMTKRDYRKREGFSFGAEKQEVPAVFILVVGESARYDRWSINGYARNTSPRLAALPDLVSYSDVFAAANGTKHAIPVILSRATPERYFDAFGERSIAGLFAEAGFVTAWITAHEKDIYQPDAALFEKIGYGDKDERFVDVARRLMRQHERLFLILHMTGSHYNYDRRTPPEFMHFRPTISDTDGYDKTKLLDLNLRGASKQELDNSYDNTILYTDHVLASLIDLLAVEKREATLLYTSDHGESLWDDERKLLYHMRSIDQVGMAELQVPLFVYANDAYRARHPQTWQQLRNNRDKPVSHSHIFHTMAALADIRYPTRNDTMSLTSDTLQAKRPRMFLDPAGVVRTENDVR